MQKVLCLVVVFFLAVFSVYSFDFIENDESVQIIIDNNCSKTVSAVAEMFADDLELLTGRDFIVSNKLSDNCSAVVAGVYGHSVFLEEMQDESGLDLTFLDGKFEAFIVRQIVYKGNPLLVVAGSDRRGCAYGMLEVSRQLGVHPLHWWSEIPVKKNDNPVFTDEIEADSPSVKFRGIFLNDEDFALHPWAAKGLDSDLGDIGPATYEKVFQLLLRLKANCIWPAMRHKTGAFYSHPENPEMADKYGIIVGSSHCEPMQRNNLDEWKHFKYGAWNYRINKQKILKYWETRVIESKNYENFYTVGMRAIHDDAMPGGGTIAEKAELLSSVIADQRELIDTHLGRPETIPQVFCPYKEVLELYRHGINLPQDITLLWVDDNYGYIRQFPDSNEKKRSGGNGVYYHFSYMGHPQSYLWLSTQSPALTRSEMLRAYRNGADRLWIFNVGDLKPAEFELQYALEMAYRMDNPIFDDAAEWTRKWAEPVYGEEAAEKLVKIKEIYYRLCAAGRPEHLNLLRFSYAGKNSEADQRNSEFSEAAALSDEVFRALPENLKDSWFHLVDYQVKSAALLNNRWYLAQKAAVTGEPGFFLKARREIIKAGKEIRNLTELYNAVGNGKWKHIMTYKPRSFHPDAAVFKLPSIYCGTDKRKGIADTAVYNDLIKMRLKSSIKQKPLVLTAEDVHRTDEVGGSLVELNWLGPSGKVIEFITDKIDSVGTLYFEIPKKMVKSKGKVRVELRFLPGFPTSTESGMRYSLECVAAGFKTSGDLTVESKSKEWFHRVIQGFAVNSFELDLSEISQDNAAELKLNLLSDGLRFDSIRIYLIK
jgi:hypothetical protein